VNRVPPRSHLPPLLVLCLGCPPTPHPPRPTAPTPTAENAPNPRPTPQVNVTADHRIIYGADAAEFLQSLKAVIEHPEQML
jgi:hypothetical protein